MLKGSMQAVSSWPPFLNDRTTAHAAVVVLLDKQSAHSSQSLTKNSDVDSTNTAKLSRSWEESTRDDSSEERGARYK